MFDSGQKSVGPEHITGIGVLIVGSLFYSAVLVASRAAAYVSLPFAMSCGALCVILSWFDWKQWPGVRIPSLAMRAAQ